MTVPALTTGGVVPYGRWRVGLAEVEAAFVVGRAEPRPSIWAEFETATTALQSIAHVCAMWLGGSFFTSKTDPGDVDCVYLVDERSKPTSPHESALFDLFAGSGRLHAITGLRVDSYILPWGYRQDRAIDISSEVPLMHRGYWDDWWQRRRHGSKGTAHPQDPIPERGYLEVILDDFIAAAP